MVIVPDYIFMAGALRLAERGLYSTDPNPRVGCIVVKDGKVVGEGWHCRAGGDHAEVMALRQAGQQARGAEIYVNLEPCCHHGRTPPCSDALIAAGVSRVVVAMQDPNPRVAGKGIAQLQEAGIQVECGVMQREAERLNIGFVSRMSRDRPWVRCKLAMSMDGRTALANGVSQWISSEAAREDVQRWRARSSAVMTGIGTVLADDPALIVRLPPSSWQAQGCGGEVRQPLRVVMDNRLRMPVAARILQQPGETWVFTSAGQSKAIADLTAAGAKIVTLAGTAGETSVNPGEVLAHLAEAGVNELWVEAGPTLSGALLRGGWIDELVIYMAPLIMGDAARGLFQLPAFRTLAECLALEVTEVRAVGNDWRITARVKRPQG